MRPAPPRDFFTMRRQAAEPERQPTEAHQNRRKYFRSTTLSLSPNGVNQQMNQAMDTPFLGTSIRAKLQFLQLIGIRVAAFRQTLSCYTGESEA